MAEKKRLDVEVTVYESVAELQEEDKRLLEAATRASHRAYAPYSGFYVGAAVLLQDGTVVEGNNQENAAYPSGLCAERVALFYASSMYPGKKINTIAITARALNSQVSEPVSPCGACRQAIAEYENNAGAPIRLIMSGQTGKIYEVGTIAALLPLAFNKQALINS